MKNASITALGLVLVGGSAYAASDFVDTAQVISSTPVIERVTESNQLCDPAPASQSNSNDIAGSIIGGVVGGLLGHQVGHGSGQTAATIIGAAGGAAAGSAIAKNSNSRPAQSCRTVQTTREVVNGYDVVYRYNGRNVNVRLPYNPGSTIRVGISVVPDDRAADAGPAAYGYTPPPPPGYAPPPPPSYSSPSAPVSYASPAPLR
jgi:uncharacterized protein YcfJ